MGAGGWGRVGRHAGSAALAYLAGTLPTADLVARTATRGEVDVHRAGSGNPGAVNVAQVVGTRWGLGVMAIDVGKGVVACRVASAIAGPAAAHLAGPAAVVGHCYPVWHGFRDGGKGVATSVGQVLATFPAYFPIDFAVGAATAAIPTIERRAFAATAAASAAWIAASVVWWRRQLPNLWGPRPTAALPAAAAISSAIILHRFANTSRVDASSGR